MAKIKDVVTLKSGYSNFVELKSAFEEAQENTDRMAMYRPTRAHNRAFERIFRGLFQPTDNWPPGRSKGIREIYETSTRISVQPSKRCRQA